MNYEDAPDDGEPCCDGCRCDDPECPHEHCTCRADARRREGEQVIRENIASWLIGGWMLTFAVVGATYFIESIWSNTFGIEFAFASMAVLTVSGVIALLGIAIIATNGEVMSEFK